ncbi:hypothetical protein FNV43_RR13271 [Rhamnella rubrinervis]|uniref:Uncharacterized protein n=1 Tax=Rhamnella rubrinervis TaxID=2594499 RepID=A0A8K0H0W4_9ROSA|nr:hypothetical protein FNV43_RR13271 [Rhamnella rubrinervis]
MWIGATHSVYPCEWGGTRHGWGPVLSVDGEARHGGGSARLGWQLQKTKKKRVEKEKKSEYEKRGRKRKRVSLKTIAVSGNDVAMISLTIIIEVHKAAGGFIGIKILSKPRIPVPFPDPGQLICRGIGTQYCTVFPFELDLVSVDDERA